MEDAPKLHEYIEKDKEYLLKIKINTDDIDTRSDLASLIFGSLLNGKPFLEGADCLSFFRVGYDENQVIEDSKERIINNIKTDLLKQIESITIDDIIPYHTQIGDVDTIFDITED